MNKQVAFQEMVEILKEFGECVVTLKNGDTCSISGKSGYFMSNELDNVMYVTETSICDDLLNWIGDEEIEKISVN